MVRAWISTLIGRLLEGILVERTTPTCTPRYANVVATLLPESLNHWCRPLRQETQGTKDIFHSRVRFQDKTDSTIVTQLRPVPVPVDKRKKKKKGLKMKKKQECPNFEFPSWSFLDLNLSLIETAVFTRGGTS